MSFSNVSIKSVGPSTQGTVVEVDGKRIKGVTRIELVASVNDVWHAVIHLIPDAIEVSNIDSKYVEWVKSGLPGIAQVKK
jgi:hypothetical protein